MARRRPYQLRTRGGAGCELRPGTSDWWIFLKIFVFGYHQQAKDDIRRSKVIVDIGANVVFFAVYAAAMNPEVEIHAFEPFPKNVAQLKKNLLLNSGRRIHVYPEAVADKTGVATLYFTPGDDSGCSLIEAKGQSCSVDVVGVNDLFNRCGIEKCDLLKMDCEGSELAILTALPLPSWKISGRSFWNTTCPGNWMRSRAFFRAQASSAKYWSKSTPCSPAALDIRGAEKFRMSGS